MKAAFSRSGLLSQLSAHFADPTLLAAAVTDPNMPQELVDWLTMLGLLHGVPFNYLVPDEAMLPPESIRFFVLDQNWTSALVDGAKSIGRNLSPDLNTPELNLQRAVHPTVTAQLQANSGAIRAAAFGVSPPLPDTAVISGFVLRSSLVADYPDMGLMAYSKDDPSTPLDILRWERLGPTSDTLICLVAGLIQKASLHEAPQALHYGIDIFKVDVKETTTQVTAQKDLYTFGINTTTNPDGTKITKITMSQKVNHTDISACFRKASPRVVSMSTLASTILAANTTAPPPPGTQRPTTIDAASMGFEMTQGVGMVSFNNTPN